MKALFAVDQCLPRLAQRLRAQVIRTRFYRVAGMGESDLDQLIAPIYTKYTNPVTTILAAPSDIQIHLRARCATAEEAEALLAEVGPPIEALLGDRIYSRNGDSLEAVVGAMLAAKGATLSAAESCTGGMFAQRTGASIAGSSRYFVGGFLVTTTISRRNCCSASTAISSTLTPPSVSRSRARWPKAHANAPAPRTQSPSPAKRAREAVAERRSAPCSSPSPVLTVCSKPAACNSPAIVPGSEPSPLQACSPISFAANLLKS